MYSRVYRVFVIVVLLFFFSINSAQALGDPVKISTSTNATVFPQVVSDSNGYLHMTWMEVADFNSPWWGEQNPGILYSRWNGDAWSAPFKISENSGFAEMSTLAVD